MDLLFPKKREKKIDSQASQNSEEKWGRTSYSSKPPLNHPSLLPRIGKRGKGERKKAKNLRTPQQFPKLGEFEKKRKSQKNQEPPPKKEKRERRMRLRISPTLRKEEEEGDLPRWIPKSSADLLLLLFLFSGGNFPVSLLNPGPQG